MEWSRPKQQGVTPEPRAGHAGVTIGEYWFITGGGNSRKGKVEISDNFITPRFMSYNSKPIFYGGDIRNVLINITAYLSIFVVWCQSFSSLVISFHFLKKNHKNKSCLRAPDPLQVSQILLYSTCVLMNGQFSLILRPVHPLQVRWAHWYSAYSIHSKILVFSTEEKIYFWFNVQIPTQSRSRFMDLIISNGEARLV